MAYRNDEQAAAELRAAQQREVAARLPELAELRIARPCQEPWDAMRGEGNVRHCMRCDKDVFNLSGMSRQEVADLLYRRGQDLCARFFRRSDGTIMTADCVDARRLRARRRIGVGAVAAGMAAAAAVPLAVEPIRSATVAGAYAGVSRPEAREATEATAPDRTPPDGAWTFGEVAAVVEPTPLRLPEPPEPHEPALLSAEISDWPEGEWRSGELDPVVEPPP